jgi:hypothetical protein
MSVPSIKGGRNKDFQLARSLKSRTVRARDTHKVIARGKQLKNLRSLVCEKLRDTRPVQVFHVPMFPLLFILSTISHTFRTACCITFP